MSNTINNFVATVLQWLFLLLLVVFTYETMYSLIFQTFSSVVNVVRMAVCCIALLYVLFYRNKTALPAMNILLVWWIIYHTIVYIGIGSMERGKADYFILCFAPSSYFIAYYLVQRVKNIYNLLLITFTVIIFLSIYMIFLGYQNMQINVNDAEELMANNLIYFPLCALPFVFLIKSQLIKNILFFVVLVTCLIAMKRTATIIISVIAIVYIYREIFVMKRERIGWSRVLFIGIIFVGVYYIITQMSENITMISERMNSISEDQGSGRIPLYKDVFNVMSKNDLFAWIYGNGMGSIKITNHTNAHNDALQMLFEFGFIGLLLYIILAVIIVKRTFYLYKLQSPYFMAYVASFIIFIMLGLVSNLVVFYSYFAYITTLWGVIEGSIAKEKIENKSHI